MRFDKIMLVGTGKIANDCLNYLMTLVYHENLVVLETGNNSLSTLKRICKSHGLVYIVCKGGENDCILNNIKGHRTLIISANNRFIFTPAIINSAGTVIINFHYSLLPSYRGMNIPTWVIYNQEKQTGITWHYVTEQIDHGKIISQKTIDIEETTTALDIVREGMILGIEAFKEFIEELLSKDVEGQEVLYPMGEPVYKSATLPMNGILELPQPIAVITRMLHCFDYGGAKLIPTLKVLYKDNYFLLKYYKERSPVECMDTEYKMQDGNLTIKENHKEIVLFLTPLVHQHGLS